MRKHIGVNDKKNEIRLLFNHPLYKNKVMVIVEGGSDVRLFRNIMNAKDIQFESIDGKKQLISSMKDLITEFPNKLLAICDADHDHLTGHSEDLIPFSIYITDYHDAEIMMLNSEAMQCFIHEFSNPKNVLGLEDGLFNSALDAAYFVGALRWINADHNLNLNFKGLDFRNFVTISQIDINVDVTALIKELLNRSPRVDVSITEGQMGAMLHDYLQKQECRFQVCCGHDVTNIVAMIYRQKWASIDLNMNMKKVESALRLGYQRALFEQTKLFYSISTRLRELNVTF